LLTGPLRRLGLRIPEEMKNLLRFGRGVDNRVYKATGFNYGFTSRETVIRLGEHLRLAPIIRARIGDDTYRYEREVEEFLRWSPHVRRERESEGVGADTDPLGI
jgi:UDP-glucose 4-epimerase